MLKSGRRHLLLAVGTAIALSACGRKGDLELPPVDPVPGDDLESDETQ